MELDHNKSSDDDKSSNDKATDDDDNKDQGMSILLNDGSDMTLLIRKGKKAQEFFKDGTFPDPTSNDNAKFNIFLTIIKKLLQAIETDRLNKIKKRCIRISEETIIIANDSVTKSKFDNLYGKAIISGYGNVEKGYSSAMRACGAINGNNHNDADGFLSTVIGRKYNTVNNYCNIANGGWNNTSKRNRPSNLDHISDDIIPHI